MSPEVYPENEECEGYIEDWNEFLYSAKELFDKQFDDPVIPRIPFSDFEYIQTIAFGGFSQVVLARLKKDCKFYAVKLYDKEKLVQNYAVDLPFRQKSILSALRNIWFPFKTTLIATYHDNSYIYFVEQYSNGGGLGTHVRLLKGFDEGVSRFFAAQALLALEFLHHLGVMFRDLTTDNFIVKSNGYVKLINFGLCTRLKKRAYTICGTAEYMAPEMIFGQGYGMALDFWTLGILIYDLNFGKTPFYSSNRVEMVERIDEGDFEVPHTASKDLKSLIKGLIQRDLSRRLGNLKAGVEDVKSHPWFSNTDWMAMLNQQVKPPYKPTTTGTEDAIHYRNYSVPLLQVSNEDLYAEYFKDF